MLSKDLVAASARPLILGILAEGESYGYEIIQRVKALSEGQVEWKDGMLYPVLHRLEKQGCIEAYWQKAGGRRRRYYRLKAVGRQALAEEGRQWQLVQAMLVKVWGDEPCFT
ncbi:MAG: PadR family transcriptional regulator [Candidatus Latescibacteria bacterium]|nr:PadR family transcriptional regulator [Candidatus Latescibacterota bacterium]